MKTNSKSLSVNLKTYGQALKSLGLPNKSGGCIVGALAENQIVNHDTKPILKTFKSFYSSLAGNLLASQSCQIDIQLNLYLIIQARSQEFFRAGEVSAN